MTINIIFTIETSSNSLFENENENENVDQQIFQNSLFKQLHMMVTEDTTNNVQRMLKSNVYLLERQINI